MPKLNWAPATLLAPVPPVLVTCGTMERPNVFTVAWTGIVNSEPAITYISVRPSRYSYGLIEETGEFVINLPSRALVRACDYVGVRTGAKENKFAAAGLTMMPASQVSAPLIPKSPLALECRVTQKLPLGSHTMFLAEIVAVDVDEQYVDANGRLRLDKADLIAYAHGDYYALGERLGSFGYSVRKKPKEKPRSGAKAAPKAVEPPREALREPRPAEPVPVPGKPAPKPAPSPKRGGITGEREHVRAGSAKPVSEPKRKPRGKTPDWV